MTDNGSLLSALRDDLGAMAEDLKAAIHDAIDESFAEPGDDLATAIADVDHGLVVRVEQADVDRLIADAFDDHAWKLKRLLAALREALNGL